MSATDDSQKKQSTSQKDQADIEQSFKRLKELFDRRLTELQSGKPSASPSDWALAYQQGFTGIYRRTQNFIHCNNETVGRRRSGKTAICTTWRRLQKVSQRPPKSSKRIRRQNFKSQTIGSRSFPPHRPTGCT